MGSEFLAFCDVAQESGAEKILYIVLGAILATLGGIIVQKWQNSVLKGWKDRGALLEALDILADIAPNFDELNVPPNDLKELCKRVLPSARRIQTRRYRQLADNLIEFAFRYSKQTKVEVENIIDEISKKISRPYYGYRKQEKELFIRAAQEIREGLKKKNKGSER